MFNLLRLCIVQQENDLQPIDAVLVAGICLPQCFNTLHHTDIFEDFNEDKSKLILDMYFYTVNWFREIVTAFVTVEKFRSMVMIIFKADHHIPKFLLNITFCFC